MPAIEARHRGRTTTQGRARGALSERWRSLARRKRGTANFVGGACQCAPQVIRGIGMSARKLRTGQTENGFHVRWGAP